MDRRRCMRLLVGSGLWLCVFVAFYIIRNPAGSKKASQNTHSAQQLELDLDDDDSGLVTPKLQLALWSKDGLPDFELVNQQNRPVSKADLIGRPWIASFIFTRCAGTCPRVANQLRVLQDRLKGVPIRLVSFSVQPENDTPEVLAKYADNLGANLEKWQFLTGDRDVIHRLVKNGFYQYVAPSQSLNPEPGWEVEHSNNLCLVNAEGVVVGKYNSLNEGEISLLRKDIDRLVKTGSVEAMPVDKERKAGSPKT